MRSIPHNALLLLALGWSAVAGCGSGDDDPAPGNSSPSDPVEDRSSAKPSRVTTLTTFRLEDGRKLVLESKSSESGGSCLRLFGVDERSRTCLLAPSEVDPPRDDEDLIAQAVAQAGKRKPLEVYGATSADVDRVSVMYRLNRARKSKSATISPVPSRSKLAEAGIRSPFRLFVVELPSEATPLRALAKSRRGGAVAKSDLRKFSDQPREALISG